MKRLAKILLLVIAIILLSITVIIVIGTAITMHEQSEQQKAMAQLKTNRDYLKEIIDKHISAKIAADIIAKTKTIKIPVPVTEEDWKWEENRLTKCIDDEQKKYLASNDPYLDQTADENSADTLAVKFLAVCHVTIAPH